MGSVLSATEVETFQRDGYLVLPRLATRAECAQMLAVAQEHLRAAVAPLEYEADVGYPGAPASVDSPGGKTARRLRGAHQRHECFRQWAQDARLIARLAQLFDEDVCLSLAHHNCIMTKQPRFSSATGWHRDIRYWSYARPDLISVWLALGAETEANGALKFIPGSHRMDIQPGQLDPLDFLRPEVTENQPLFARGKAIELQPGDVILFHSALFHAAGKNTTNATKFSVAFAYHGQSNMPLAGTKSAAGDILLGR